MLANLTGRSIYTSWAAACASLVVGVPDGELTSDSFQLLFLSVRNQQLSILPLKYLLSAAKCGRGEPSERRMSQHVCR